MSVEVGQQAPDFSLDGSQGTVALSQYRGQKNVLLAFYPGDFTPVCTKELTCFVEDWSKFDNKDTVILGISTGSVDNKNKFAASLGAQFPLLSDSDKRVAALYGVSGFLGVARAYFIVDKQGIVRYKHVESIPIFKREDEELLGALAALS
ncbi:peroxiredoxin [Gloeobacter kilaueensis]|uniref:thioredoxin-dependent peroxiredoxin n=1 Tax=Gloeobacter kilaueensis (strain ATCC BAA-2537 / CCAP 1431/1 / ULC 316 / JS1) TaxID=1183438 RepID=U5QHD5_GLOK1|nr:peroxiredoxin [Gloeobacter kilaueensis]AGY57080.1 alkyl hydroperoxide reductase/ Thiol specific antioxidant/ Mal allergen [Gloeobacter kilaueensis JS1]